MEPLMRSRSRPGEAHLKVRIDRALGELLRDFAENNRLSVSDAVRLLLRRELEGIKPEEIRSVHAVALAALLAAEHAALAIEKISPQGTENRPLLIEESASLARLRLDRVERAVAPDDS